MPLAGLSFLPYAFALTLNATATPSLCMRVEKPKIYVTLSGDDDAPIIDQTEAQADFKSGTVDDAAYMKGVTRSAVGVNIKQKVDTGVQPFSLSHFSCLWYDTIEVELTYKPVIKISQELRNDSCEYNAVLTHQRKHIDADRKIVKKYMTLIEEDITRALQKSGTYGGPYNNDKVQSVSTAMQIYIQKTVRKTLDQLEIERAKAQKTIDTPDEYYAVRNQCTF
jgi:hypothetical protein